MNKGGTAKLEGLDVERRLGDVTDRGSLEAAVVGVEAVVHCAGVVSYWQRKADWQWAVNVGGTEAVLDAAAAADVRRVLLTSSIAALGSVTGEGLGDEGSPWNWQGVPYCETKRAAQDRVLSEQRLEGLAVNPGITFGSHDLHRNAGRMLLQVAQGGPPGVPPGSTTAANLEDVVAGHLLALDLGAAGESYVLGGHTPSFLELYQRVADVLGQPAPTRIVQPWMMRLFAGWGWLRSELSGSEQPVMPPLVDLSTANRRYSSDKAARELGYAPRPLEVGIRQCLEWYRERGWL